MAQTFLVAALSPVTPAQLAADAARQGTAFYDVTRVAIGGWLATLLALTKAIGPAYSAMTGQAAAARRDDGLSLLVSVVDVGALTAFVLLPASVVGYFVVRRLAAATPWHVALPVAGALVSCWVLVEASALALVVGAVWGALGVAVVAAARGRGRRTEG